MKKTYLALAFLITGFLLAGDAYGEDEIYYCAEIDANGFKFDEKLKEYRKAEFTTNKFKIKFDRTAKTIGIKGHALSTVNGTYTCKSPYTIINPELLSCVSDLYHFNFNSNNGRFVLAMV